MRITTPYFQLFSAVLTEAVQAGLTGNFLQRMYDKFGEKDLKIEVSGAPVGLRWNMHPQFGFPRQPFRVWRRPQIYKDGVIRIEEDKNETINGSGFYYWSQGEMYVVSIGLTVAAGQSVTVYPLNREGQRIPGKEQQTTGSVAIRTPFINGIEIVGNATLNYITGLLQSDYVNYPDWQLVQLTGLPFETGDVGGQGYDGSNQGFISSPTTALHAAFQRLAMGYLLQLPMPPTGDALVPTPSWNAPDPTQYLDYLEHAGDSLLMFIKKCLESSDDASFNPNNRQPAFSLPTTIRGIHQPGLPSVDDAQINIPVVAATLLAAATDSFASLGLGFGTYDFPGARTAPNPSDILDRTSPLNGGFDYMVTGNYIIRSFENLSLGIMDTLTREFEFAALSDDRLPPVPPPSLHSNRLRLNRPMHWDGPASENIKVRWPKPLLPQGYGILSSYRDNTSQVLNTPYSFATDAFTTFNTFVPKDISLNDEAEDTDQFIFVRPDEPVPMSGAEVHKYFVAGLDIFGRWSPFQRSVHASAAMDPQKPAIMQVKIVPPANPVTGNPTLNTTLEIELAWNWKDRSVDTIEIAGQFYVADSLPSDIPPGIFSLHSANSVNDTIKITFGDRGALPPSAVIPLSSQGTIHIKPLPPADPPTAEADDLVKYILTVTNVTAIFPSGSPYQVAYAVYARALEKVRVSAADWGPWLEHPVAGRLDDPRPPAVTVLPATVQFTAIPDATKIGRGSLSWPVAAGAIGYNVWEANETALRAALGPVLESRFPGDAAHQLVPLSTGLQTRATQLRDLLVQPELDSLCARSFSRYNKLLVTGTSVELELPGSTDILFVYKISSANSANIESGKSNAVFFAVPRVIKPPSPLLTVRKYKDTTDPSIKGFEVQVLNGNGKIPAGFKLFRNRKIIPNSDVGMKGLPYKQPDDTGWQAYQSALRDDPSKILAGKKLVDIITERSWKPFAYQAVAIGIADTPNGLLSGESGGSVTQVMYLPPETPPLLLEVSPVARNSFSALIICNTNIPFSELAIGFSTIELVRVSTDTSGKFVKEVVQKWKAAETLIAPGDLSLVTTDAEAAQPSVARRTTDNTGITRFSIVFAAAIATGMVRVTDPLGRATEILFG